MFDIPYLKYIVLFLLLPFAANGKTEKNYFDYTLSYTVDSASKYTRNNVLSENFKEADVIPNLGLIDKTVWIRIITRNKKAKARELFLGVLNPTISQVLLYRFNDSTHGNTPIEGGQNTVYSKKQLRTVNPSFRINLRAQQTDTFLLRVRSSNVMLVPVDISAGDEFVTNIITDITFACIYLGLMLVMFLYNSFIYVSVKDNNYLYYVFYILSVAITQFCLKGYAGKMLWPENVWMLKHCINISIGLSGVFSLLFIIKFLHPEKYYPVFYYICIVSIVIDAFGIILSLFNDYNFSQNIFQTINGIDAIVVLLYGLAIYAKGYKPALFFNISWFFFLAGVFTFILKDVGFLSNNAFTSNAILLGSGIEATLLSFALADKINIYKKEKEESQVMALKISRENEQLVREQNVILEYKVKERTEELELTLHELKEAQTQLVESEKMASLGQLTAGIAHEINNPINFVTANINPLQRDIDMLDNAFEKIEKLALSEKTIQEKEKAITDIKEDIEYDYLKTEIQYLLKGIREGSSRTAEIVKGLRIFSRVDEDDLKRVDIHEGIDATLVIANTLLNSKIQVIKEYGQLPLVDCYPGKLNQVFINIISNGIHAIKKRWNDNIGGKITISTHVEGEEVVIRLSDNGTGMDETTMKRIFEPFFTTKDVGEGTGLGLSIVYNIMKKHNANLNVESAIGVGTTFIITLPVNTFSDGR